LGRAYLATKLHFFSKERRLEGVLEMASQTKVWLATKIGHHDLFKVKVFFHLERGLAFINTSPSSALALKGSPPILTISHYLILLFLPQLLTPS
jgi:hypothetical protein